MNDFNELIKTIKMHKSRESIDEQQKAMLTAKAIAKETLPQSIFSTHNAGTIILRKELEKKIIEYAEGIINSIENPYPLSVFASKSKEAKMGQFGYKVFENFKEDLLNNIE